MAATENPDEKTSELVLKGLTDARVTLDAIQAAADGALTKSDKARLLLWRQAQIVRMRVLEGKEWAAIAAELGISDRYARILYAEWRDENKLELAGEDPMEVVQEQLAAFRTMRAQAYELFTKATTGNTAAKLGALKMMMDCRIREVELRQETGMLPKNLGKVQVDISWRVVREEFFRIVEKYEIAPEAALEFAEALSPSRTLEAAGVHQE